MAEVHAAGKIKIYRDLKYSTGPIVYLREEFFCLVVNQMIKTK